MDTKVGELKFFKPKKGGLPSVRFINLEGKEIFHAIITHIYKIPSEGSLNLLYNEKEFSESCPICELLNERKTFKYRAKQFLKKVKQFLGDFQ